MEAKTGDRISIDAKKVGQPRRTGVISNVTKGLSGLRYRIRWDDGLETVLSPGGGNLTVEGRTRGNSHSKRPTAKKKSKTRAPKKSAKRGKR